MIKGGGTINNQVNEAYSGGGLGGGTGKMGSQNIKNGSFYQSKYISNASNGANMNQSPSPSQTFFKENPPMMMMETSKKPNQNISSMNPQNTSNYGKKPLPNTYKNPKKLYVSPYS